MAFVAKLRRARSIADIQHLAGSKGKITQRDNKSGRLSYHWVSDGGDFMLVLVYPDNNWGASLSNATAPDIVVNSFGAFSCDRCRPPVNICGRRPSWIKPGEEWGCY